MAKLLQEINQGRVISFADPDNEPGAIEREHEARHKAAGRHFNATEVLKNEVAKKLNATVSTWIMKDGRLGPEEWATLKLPEVKTAGGKKLAVKIGFDPFYRGYGIDIVATHRQKDGPFVETKELAQELHNAIKAAWNEATGEKLYDMDIGVPVDKKSYDAYYSPIRVVRVAPSEKLPAKKMAAGVKAIIDAVKAKL